MAYTTQIAWEILRSVDSSTVLGSYVALGGPLTHPAYKIKMVNVSNILVTVSIDGVNPIDVAPANSFWLYDEDVTNNHESIPSGTQIFVKSATGAGGVGLIYLVVQYLQVN